MNNGLSAVLNGLAMGKMALSGLVPSGSTPRGGPPPVDPLTGDFQQALNCLNKLIVGLSKQGDQRRMLEIQDIATKIQRISIDRQEQVMNGGDDEAMEGESFRGQFPSVNGGGIV
jgi:hypothetical protein